MQCCQCVGIEELFDGRAAAAALKRYQHKGPSRTTQILVEALAAAGVQGRTLLDIGGGIGAIQHELLTLGAARAVSVEASAAFHEASRAEAERRGYGDMIVREHGDFVKLAEQVEPADIVTLDRVICCFDNMVDLVELSASKTRQLYGVVFPKDGWGFRAVSWLANGALRIRRSQFQTFIHSTAAVDAILRQAGLEPHFARHTAVWQILVYARWPAGS